MRFPLWKQVELGFLELGQRDVVLAFHTLHDLFLDLLYGRERGIASMGHRPLQRGIYGHRGFE